MWTISFFISFSISLWILSHLPPSSPCFPLPPVLKFIISILSSTPYPSWLWLISASFLLKSHLHPIWLEIGDLVFDSDTWWIGSGHQAMQLFFYSSKYVVFGFIMESLICDLLILGFPCLGMMMLIHEFDLGVAVMINTFNRVCEISEHDFAFRLYWHVGSF